jgi:hypothetical protein
MGGWVEAMSNKQPKTDDLNLELTGQLIARDWMRQLFAKVSPHAQAEMARLLPHIDFEMEAVGPLLTDQYLPRL